MRASAVARVERHHGRDVLTVRRAEAPVSLRPSGDRVLIASSAAHPVGGDVIDVEVDVGDDACARIGTVAATVVWPGPDGSPSEQRTTCDVGRGGHLDLHPEPTVAVTGARHSAITRVSLDGTATCRLVEELVLGRSGEPSGAVRLSVRVERDGAPLVHHDEWFGTDDSLTSVSAGAARHVLTTVTVGPAAGRARSIVERTAAGAVLPVADDAAIAIVLAADRSDACRLLTELAPTETAATS